MEIIDAYQETGSYRAPSLPSLRETI